MATYKRGDVYWYEFMWKGQRIRESTHQGNDHVARTMESTHKGRLAMGEVGIREKVAAPTLKQFFEKDFLPFVDAKFAEKPNTKRYYHNGARMLFEVPEFVDLRIDKITDQHAHIFASRKSKLSPSTVNQGLRTLLRALNLAVEWGKTDKEPRITLAKGERKRTRVLKEKEQSSYLAVCTGDWRDGATIMLGTGMRPGEIAAMRWELVTFNPRGGGLIQISEGKSEAAKRQLPMLQSVCDALRKRWEAAGEPETGWVFPSRSKSGHITTFKKAHGTALKNSGVAHFVPYTLRHTAATDLIATGCDVFVLSRILGHSSITITQRYVHPQKEAVEMAFARYDSQQQAEGPHKTPHSLKIMPRKQIQEIGVRRVVSAR